LEQKKKENIELGLGCLTPLSTIVQLYHGGANIDIHTTQKSTIGANGYFELDIVVLLFLTSGSVDHIVEMVIVLQSS